MVYLIVTSLIWAFSFGLIGNVLKGLDPLSVASVRLVVALVVFLPFVRPGRVAVRDRWFLMLLGAIQFGLMYVCYLSAFRFIPSHLVALFSVLTPVYVVLIHSLRKKRISAHYLLAALLSVAGASVIKVKAGESGQFWAGFGLMQLAGLAFAYGQVEYRDWKRKHAALRDRDAFGLLYVGGAVLALVASSVLSPGAPAIPQASPNQWLVMCYLGAVASGLGFFFWNVGAARSTPGALAACNNAVVPMAMFASLFVFGEISDVRAGDLVRLGLGAVLIAAAVVIGQRGQPAARE